MADSAIPPLPPQIPAPPVIGLAAPPLPVPPVIRRPSVVLAYRLWCLLFIVIYCGIATMEILVACKVIEPDLGLIESAVSYHNPKVRAEIIAEKRADAPGVAVFAFCIATAYAAAAAVPRKPWSWMAGLIVNIT